MPPYQLVANCTVADAAGLAENNMSAFWQNAWYRIIWPGRALAYHIEVVTGRTPQNLLRGRDVRRHQKAVDAASGQLVGYARWVLPAALRAEWLEAQTPDVADKEEMRRYVEAFSNSDWKTEPSTDVLDAPIHQMRDRHRPRRPYMELDYLGVHPAHQHKGIGSMLVQSGVDKAQQLGLDILLVAMGANAKGMYLKHGFELCEETSQSLEPWGEEDSYDTAIMVWRHATGQREATTDKA